MNSQIRTHYDNLKVSRNAPNEVIRAAYKSLSQKYHPDRNNGDAAASQIMKILNESYAVLSTPEKRKEHDNWIVKQESTRAIKPEVPNNHYSTFDPRKNPYPSSPQSDSSFIQNAFSSIIEGFKRLFLGVFTYVFGIAIILGVFGGIAFIADFFTDESSSVPNTKAYDANPQFAKQPNNEVYKIPMQRAYIRPVSDPNGNAWPIKSGYISAEKKLNLNGLSTVTVDNSQNDSDVYVKLVSLDGQKAYPARIFFIPAFDKFKINKITAGNYDIRYRDLSSGHLARSEQFELTETNINNGTEFSNITMTLYKVQNGNMQTFDLSEKEF